MFKWISEILDLTGYSCDHTHTFSHSTDLIHILLLVMSSSKATLRFPIAPTGTIAWQLRLNPKSVTSLPFNLRSLVENLPQV